jgi:hypothetical protein
MYVIFSWNKLIKEGTADIEKPKFFKKIGALLHDPLKFGPGWQMVFMNFVVSGVGIFMAVKLDEIFRVWPHRDERITLSGHWHILAALIATIILLYFGDLSGLKGKVRKWYGWIIIIMSDLAFASATIFSMKRLFVPESEQQSLVNTLMLLMDMGLALVLLALAIFMGWRLFDLFKKNGLWSKELAAERKINAETEIEESKRKLDELQATQEEVSK